MGRARFWWPNLTTTVCRSSEVLPAAARALMLKCSLTRWGCSAGIRPGNSRVRQNLIPRATACLLSGHTTRLSLAASTIGSLLLSPPFPFPLLSPQPFPFTCLSAGSDRVALACAPLMEVKRLHAVEPVLWRAKTSSSFIFHRKNIHARTHIRSHSHAYAHTVGIYWMTCRVRRRERLSGSR